MKGIALLLAGVVAVFGAIGSTSPRLGNADGRTAPIYPTIMPSGYRDWKLVSVAHEEGDINDIRAILANDVGIKAYRERKLPFPEGTILARLAWRYDESKENDKVFGRQQSFVAGPAKGGVQFMVKDLRKYASTGGWGFAQFDDGKLVGDAKLQTCFSCHQANKAHDLVFTNYAP